MSAEQGQREHKKDTGLLRFLLYIALIASVAVTTVCWWGMEFWAQKGLFVEPLEEEQMITVDDQTAKWDGIRLLYANLVTNPVYARPYDKDAEIMYAIYTTDGTRIAGTLPSRWEKYAITETYTNETAWNYAFTNITKYEIKMLYWQDVMPWMPVTSDRRMEFYLVYYRNYFIAGFVACMTLSVLLFVLLVRGSRRRPLLGGIALELVTALAGLGIFYCYRRIMQIGTENVFNGTRFCGYAVLIAVVSVIYCLHLVRRLREEKWYQRTLVYSLYSATSDTAERCAELVNGIPMVWRLGLKAVAACAAEAAVIWLILPDGKSKWILGGVWLASKLVLLPMLLYRELSLKKIEKAAGELASGNLNYQVETKNMPRALQRFGGDMNAVSDSVSVAVEDRLKSERLKTELITNVSHDIKTPLTSIINFADLINKEKTENAKITEYAGLLHKQSTRMKKLIEDLIEASKASTGSLEMHPEPCEVRTLLAQCLGEYEQRLKEMGIDLIIKLGQEPVWIKADTKMLWRIFDNLMNNIYKYTQKETRVYLTTEQKEQQVFITFKNISKYQMDVTAEELTERFVRGDRSRHTEGNGLGLSIVKSLMDLQGGSIQLAVDGDLFKAILEFPVIEYEGALPKQEPSRTNTEIPAAKQEDAAGGADAAQAGQGELPEEETRTGRREKASKKRGRRKAEGAESGAVACNDEVENVVNFQENRKK